MSKASLKASIEVKKADIARYRTEIAKLHSRKSEMSARFSARIKNASTASSKASIRNEKVSACGYIDSQIRANQGYIAQKQRDIASLRERMKYEK